MQTYRPEDIEKKSFSIIEDILVDTPLNVEQAPVIKRVIHTTADFDYVDNLYFSEGAIEKALKALRAGCDIVTDTQMVKAGINKTLLKELGGEVHCFMADEDVREEAKRLGVTRASVSMIRAASLAKPCIVAIGNAPTALMRVSDLIHDGRFKPVLVIAVPVGFVNVIESKELIMKAPVHSIVARGRKGGSNVAAAICNALIYRLRR